MMTAAIFQASCGTGFTQHGKRKKLTARGGQHAKRQCHGEAIGAAPSDSIAVSVALPPQAAAAMAFPITSVSGTAPRWSTAAVLEASSRAGEVPLPPLMVGARNRHGLQALSAARDVVAPNVPYKSVAPAPLVFVHAAGQLVPMPIRFYGYMPMAGTEAGGTRLPLAAALDQVHSTTLARMLSGLMTICYPPVRLHESRSGAPPQWWPTGSERWWASEVAAHLPRIPTPVPFVGGKLLKKAHKVAVLVAIVKHLSPDFGRIAAAVRRCGLSASEAALWNSALEYEQVCCVRPVYVVQMQQQGCLLAPSHAVATNDGVNPPADNVGQMVVAAAELVKPPLEQHGSVALPSDGYLQVANLIGDSGALVVTAPSDEVLQVAAAEAEPEKLQLEEEGDVDATAPSPYDLVGQQLEDMLLPLPAEQANDDLHQPADHIGKDSGAAAEAKEEPEDHPLYEDKELRRIFADMPIGSPHSFDDGWFF